MISPSRRDELAKLSEEELDRFEFYMRSHFNRKQVRELVALNVGLPAALDANASSSSSASVSRLPSHITAPTEAELERIAIAVSSLTKLFIGDMTMLALAVARDEAAVDAEKAAEAGSSAPASGAPQVSLAPRHLREAARRLSNAGNYPLVINAQHMYQTHHSVQEQQAAASSWDAMRHSFAAMEEQAAVAVAGGGEHDGAATVDGLSSSEGGGLDAAATSELAGGVGVDVPVTSLPNVGSGAAVTASGAGAEQVDEEADDLLEYFIGSKRRRIGDNATATDSEEGGTPATDEDNREQMDSNDGVSPPSSQ